MLTITQTAAEALDSVVASADEPETAGVRIAQGVSRGGQPGFTLAPVPAPGPSDHVLEAEDHASVFIEPDAAEFLEGKVLDAYVHGDKVDFIIAEQGG